MRTISTCALVLLTGCTVTTHPTTASTLGRRGTTQALLASLAQPGPVQLTTVRSADWAVPRSGLVNLQHPVAVDAGYLEAQEPIHLFFHVLRHPSRGAYLVDTGASTALRDAPESSGVSSLVRSAMHLDTVLFHAPLGEWLAREQLTLDGVFLTHLHLDHVVGLPDVPAATPVYLGPGEAHERALLNAFVQGTADTVTAHLGSLQEWPFGAPGGEAAAPFSGVVDVLGDASIWALWLPGHTGGSTVYLVRTPEGPVLLLGDVSHTRWGWEHRVEPGTFSSDPAAAARSFRAVRRFVDEHPSIQVRFGHTG